MFIRVRQGIRAVAVMDLFSGAGGTTVLAVVILLAVLVIIIVVWAAIWSGNEQRRRDALAVLDRLLRWKGHLHASETGTRAVRRIGAGFV